MLVVHFLTLTGINILHFLQNISLYRRTTLELEQFMQIDRTISHLVAFGYLFTALHIQFIPDRDDVFANLRTNIRQSEISFLNFHLTVIFGHHFFTRSAAHDEHRIFDHAVTIFHHHFIFGFEFGLHFIHTLEVYAHNFLSATTFKNLFTGRRCDNLAISVFDLHFTIHIGEYGLVFRSAAFEKFFYARQTLSNIATDHTTGMEGAKCQLGTGFTDRLSGNNTDSGAEFGRFVVGQIKAITFATHAFR